MDERRDSNRVVGGLVLLGLGLIFLLSNFGYFPSGLWGRWWPLILIAVGLIILLRRPEPTTIPPEPPFPPGETPPGMPPAPPARPTTAHRRDFPTGAIILIGLGLAFLLEDVIGGNAFPALVLIAIGAALLLRDWNRRSR